MQTADQINRARGYIKAATHGQDITRVDVIQWEAAGQPSGQCPSCRAWIRIGLDRCCTTGKKL